MNNIITPISEKWPLLEAASLPCSIPINDTDLSIIEEMDQKLTELNESAVGLAAVQIGYPKQIFLIRRNNENEVFINPFIVNQSKETIKRQEACLSLPGLFIKLPRPKKVTISYYDLFGSFKTEEFCGFYARVIMHEMAHLNGQLISHEFKKLGGKILKRTKFGMTLDKHRIKLITKRRKKEKLRRKIQALQRKK